MVVDRYGAATADYSHKVEGKSSATTAASKVPSGTQLKQTEEDTTNFTSSTNSVQSLIKTALQSTPSRQAKVEALRQQVKAAEYQFDSAKIAQSIADSD